MLILGDCSLLRGLVYLFSTMAEESQPLMVFEDTPLEKSTTDTTIRRRRALTDPIISQEIPSVKGYRLAPGYRLSTIHTCCSLFFLEFLQ